MSLSLALIYERKTVRVVGTPEAPEWIAKDVCEVLGLSNVSKALLDLEDDEKGITSGYTLGGEQQLLTVTEAGLYRLIFRSRKPEAKAFRRWVTHEVLPKIRQTGSYSTRKTTGAALIEHAEALIKIARDHEERLSGVEVRVGQIETDRAQAQRALFELPPATVPAPEKSLAATINQLVKTYARSEGVSIEDCWTLLYDELYARAKFNVRARNPKDPETGKRRRSHLQVIEAEGHLEITYAIAKEKFVVRPRDEKGMRSVRTLGAEV